jgi:FkbM family methyltransferase
MLKIYDQNYNKIDISKIERLEQELAKNFIQENDVVLELGARYGSVSCTINMKLNDKTKQVSVEPDKRVWEALELNKKINNCNFNIIKGFISKQKLGLTNLDVCLDGYGSTCVEDLSSNITSYTLDEIKSMFNIQKFNVLVADCEGFLENFFDENNELYDELTTIIFEEDYPEKCNYKKIKLNLINKGFDQIVRMGEQHVWIKK